MYPLLCILVGERESASSFRAQAFRAHPHAGSWSADARGAHALLAAKCSASSATDQLIARGRRPTCHPRLDSAGMRRHGEQVTITVTCLECTSADLHNASVKGVLIAQKLAFPAELSAQAPQSRFAFRESACLPASRARH